VGKKPPAHAKERVEEANALIGKVEGLARQGKWDEAVAAAHTDRFGSVMQFRARLALVAAGVQAKAPKAGDYVHDALSFLQTKVSRTRDLTWDASRLAELAMRIGLPHEQVDALAKRVEDAAIRGRIELALLQATLVSGGALSPDLVEPNSVASLLAVQAVARHNVRSDPGWVKILEPWDASRQAFGWLGTAQGLQDRGK
jgi:hypothetical protein